MLVRRLPFFYGWVIVAVAFLGSGISSGVAIWGPSVFVIPMTEELGWSRTAFFSAFTVRTVLVGVSAPLVGPWLDTTRGPRLLAISGAVVLGLSLVGMRSVTEVWQWVLLYGVAGAYAELGSGFAVSQTLVPKWFVRRRGRALGISIMGVGLGALVFPSLVSWLVGMAGWRDAWLWFGIGVGVVSLALALAVRTRPEDAGLHPDGADGPFQAPEVHTGRGRVIHDRSLTRREALRTPAFWLLLVTFSLVGLGIMGFQSNWLPFLVEQGFTNAEASAGIAVYGLISGLSRPGWGLAGERVHPRFLLAGSTLVTSVLILLFLRVVGMPLLVALMLCAGVSMGGYLILRALLAADYFGRAHLGAVNSLFHPFSMTMGAVGPMLFGFLYDLRGSYTVAFGVAALAWGAAGLVVLMARPPRAPAQPEVAGEQTGR